MVKDITDNFSIEKFLFGEDLFSGLKGSKKIEESSKELEIIFEQ